MSVHYRSQGFVLQKNDFGEADRFYLLFTKDFGRLKVLAKGVRKIKAKLKSQMELFNLVEVEFIQGRRYPTLTDVLVVESFSAIKKDLARLKVAFEIADIFAKLLKGEEKDEELWNLLNETFKRLNDYSLLIAHCLLLYYYFLWNLLSLLGYQPQIRGCAICQKRLERTKNFWSNQEGGIVCPSCSIRIRERVAIDLNTLKLFKLFFQQNWQILKRVRISPKDLRNLTKISDEYLSFITSNI